ncbi:hypothetical protein VTN96DRAFT_5638 [Rasamsonia emersonii]
MARTRDSGRRSGSIIFRNFHRQKHCDTSIPIAVVQWPPFIIYGFSGTSGPIILLQRDNGYQSWSLACHRGPPGQFAWSEI